MQKTSLAAAAVLALVLAGCSGNDHKGLDLYACPDGTQADLETVAGHHDAGFDPPSACPVPPSVTLFGLPSNLGAFLTGPFSWSLDNGSLSPAHSVLTEVRYADQPGQATSLRGPESFGKLLIKKEHQAVPITYQGTLSFSTPGTYYLRAYAQINGTDYWSPEAKLVVDPVQPTGVVHDVTHAIGDFVGGVTPRDVAMSLGDAVRFVNDDVLSHTFTFQSGPEPKDAVTVDMLSASEPIPLLAPGTYTVTTNDLTPITVTLAVTLSA